ncbi:AAA family ATPase [Microbacterium hominis]|uniref:AAA family ATPase n=1 Tax=Microbacterium TaxID=33882 RepID=UPI00168AD1EE|nr:MULTISPECIES: TniB family NTP-binding protein [Microbacterium]QOC26841.1 AAA family ATPase [Microbacterium hominis]QOC28012.1 AAA family ATPase [Microbacterium hominis]QYF96828.1 TniB family NTP-binding protein [Microbacterium sp. PAMC21962]
MTATVPGEHDAPRRQRSLSTYEGWKDFAERPPRDKPALLTTEQLGPLGPDEFARYNADRRAWHANILLRTRQVHGVHLQLGDILDSNLQDSDRVKSAAALDAPPALGKSTVVNTFGRDFHRQRIAEVGEYLDEDRDILHLPVCHITVPGRLTIKGLHMMILGFYAHPATAGILHRSMAGRDLARAAADCIERHDTRLVIIDDLHFIQMRTRDGVEVANQLKWLSNEYSATFLFAGVALRERGLVGEGATGKEAAMAQTFRRWTVLSLDPYSLRTKQTRQEWDSLLWHIEQALVLADAHEGMLVDMSRYLFARTTGNIGSLMDLIRRGASRAIRTGAERIDRKLLDDIRIDEGAETERTELQAKHDQEDRARRERRRRRLKSDGAEETGEEAA